MEQEASVISEALWDTYRELQPYLLAAIAAAGAWLYQRVMTWLGKKTETEHMLAFQSALTNVAGWLAKEIGPDPEKLKKFDFGIDNPLMQAAIGRVISSVPDALKWFNILPKMEITGAPASDKEVSKEKTIAKKLEEKISVLAVAPALAPTVTPILQNMNALERIFGGIAERLK